jgi:IS1 family transposase
VSSVVNWFNAATATLKAQEVPPPGVGEPDTMALDELFTFVGTKKNEVDIVTQVHRETRCFMSWLVVHERTVEAMQPIIDAAPAAVPYYSDGLSTYEALNSHRRLHLVAPGKSQTYAVEGGNADLRHYLARLAKKFRCFSRCIEALTRAITVFVACWNKRQLYKRRYPAYNPALADFVSTCF